MAHNSSNGLGTPMSGLASRRGGPTVKPLSMDALKSPTENDTGVPTPRTSRSHLLAGLRTAPRSATAATFSASATAGPAPTQMHGRTGVGSSAYSAAQEALFNGPKTSLPRYMTQQQTQQMPFNLVNQMFTPDQVLAPPEIHIDEHGQDQMDPSLYSQLVATNMYLARQQQRLQQQLLSVQAAAQQFQGLSLGGAQLPQQYQQQQYAMQNMGLQNAYQQHHQRQAQQPLTNLPSLMTTGVSSTPNIYAYVDPVTGQQTYFVDQSQLHSSYADQAAQQTYSSMQQQYHSPVTPRVQVSPPPETQQSMSARNSSPPRKAETPVEPTPLPPPSANAFRRGHKKCSSLALSNNNLPVTGQEPPKSAGPKSASFPLTPANGGYGPGQARAGEHPIRQPRGPPSIEELRAKPTAKHEGSKNFAARTRRSAVHNLVRAGLERRKGTGSSSGSMSPVSESAEEADTPLTDNDSDSGRSGSGSLSGEAEGRYPSSRTSASGVWGAIGSDRPVSRQKARLSVDSVGSESEEPQQNSFASVFKNGGIQRGGAKLAADASDGQRKAPMLVLTSFEKRKSGSGMNMA